MKLCQDCPTIAIEVTEGGAPTDTRELTQQEWQEYHRRLTDLSNEMVELLDLSIAANDSRINDLADQIRGIGHGVYSAYGLNGLLAVYNELFWNGKRMCANVWLIFPWWKEAYWNK